MDTEITETNNNITYHQCYPNRCHILWLKPRNSCPRCIIWNASLILYSQTDQMTQEQMETFQMSVVEREVREGILTAPNPKATALVFVRKIQNINLTETKGGQFQASL